MRRIAFAFLVLVACDHKTKELAPAPAPAPVASSSSPSKTSFKIDSGGCVLTLRLEGSISATLTSPCDLAKVPGDKLGALLDQALAGATRRPLFTNLAIAGDGKEALAAATPTIEERIAVAAIKSSGWDRHRGLPVDGGYENMLSFVHELARPSVIVPELEAALRARGLCLVNDTTDLVDAKVVAEHPNKPELLALGALPIDKVPTLGTLAFYAWPTTDGGACGKPPSH